jgi:GMP synthase (glutamine-hydrolysing)
MALLLQGAKAMRGKILIIVHQPTSTPGRVGRKLAERGYRLDIRRPCMGQPLPETLENYDGVVVFGGPMSANDCRELDFIRKEIDWLGVPLKEEVPYFGICLGGQLLARHLGGKVTPHPEGFAEIGYYPIRPTENANGYGPWPDYVYQWHREGFDVPPDGVLLAEGENFPN